MRGLNVVMLIGNVTEDPRMYQSKNGSGTQIANFSLAVNESRKGPDGNYAEYAEFVRIVCFGKTAEIAGMYVKKGSQLHITGKLRTREYEKDGIKRYATEVICDPTGLILLGRKDGQGKAAAGQPAAQPQYGQGAQYGAQGTAPAPAPALAPAPAQGAGHPPVCGPSSYQGGAPAPQAGYAQPAAQPAYGYGQMDEDLPF